MTDVVVLGDVNVDIIAQFPVFPVEGRDAFSCSMEFHCGGSAANTAVALARLGVGTSLLARLGLDPWSATALDCLAQAGVILDGLQRDPLEMTGLMYIVVTPDGERTMFGHRGANMLTDPDEIRAEYFEHAKHFHLSGYALLAEPQRAAAWRALEHAASHDLSVSLDPGLGVSEVAIEHFQILMPQIDILMPSLAEARQLTGLDLPEDCAKALLDQGCGVVALKLGRRGCVLADQKQSWRVPGFAVEAQDSTGAGDGFAAGLLSGFLGGLDWPGSAVMANAIGAIVAARVGAATAAPLPGEVLALLSQYGSEYDLGVGPEVQRQVDNYLRLLAGDV